MGEGEDAMSAISLFIAKLLGRNAKLEWLRREGRELDLPLCLREIVDAAVYGAESDPDAEPSACLYFDSLTSIVIKR